MTVSRWALSPLLLLWIVACGEPAADRCNRIQIEGVLYRAGELRVDRLGPEWQALLKAGTITNAQFLDSLRQAPPPTPSDLAWEAEHCYQGKPR